MKFKTKLFAETVLGFLTIIGCFSCSSELTSEGSIESSKSIATELITFAHNQENLYVEAKEGFTGTRVGDATSSDINEDALAQMDENLQRFCSSHDIYADLTEAKKQGLLISNDSLEILSLLDVDNYLEYIKEHKSQEFYNILHEILKDKNTDLTAASIVNNEKLYLNEKIHLLLVLPAIHASSNVVTRATNHCLDEYYEAKEDCLKWYLIECGASLLTGLGTSGFGTAIGIGLSTRSYWGCDDDALYHFRECKERYEQK